MTDFCLKDKLPTGFLTNSRPVELAERLRELNDSIRVNLQNGTTYKDQTQNNTEYKSLCHKVQETTYRSACTKKNSNTSNSGIRE